MAVNDDVVDRSVSVMEATVRAADESWHRIKHKLPTPPSLWEWTPSTDFTLKDGNSVITITPQLTPIKGTYLNPFPPSD